MEPQQQNASGEKIDFFLLSAHELRTSLTAMKWLLKMLCDGDYGPLNSDQIGAVQEAERANDKMVALVNATIATIKNDTAISYAVLPVHLSVFLAEIIKEFTNEALSKHIALTYHQSSTPAVIHGDESKLRIALHNIIENAIKYSAQNTEIIVSLATAGPNAVITVQDHGVGISEEESKHLFERFFRADNSTESGTGLGLYSAKLIVERHHGTVAIQSEQGKGSTVTITLPLTV